MNPTLKQYLTKNILEELHLENLAPDAMEKLLDSMGAIIQGRVQLRIMDALSDEDKKEFYALLDTPKNDAEIDLFFKRRIPNLEELTATVIAESKQEIVEKGKLLNEL